MTPDINIRELLQSIICAVGDKRYEKLYSQVCTEVFVEHLSEHGL